MSEHQDQTSGEVLHHTVQEFHQAMAEFSAAMRRREEFSLRIGKRTTQIIRFSLIALIFLAVAMFALIHTLTENLSEITVQTREMSQNFSRVTATIHQMQTNVARMDEHMEHIRQHTAAMNHSIQYVPAMSQHVAVMGGELQEVRKDMSRLQQSVSAMTGNISRIDQGFYHLNNQMGGIGHDVDTLSSPMQFFPFR